MMKLFLIVALLCVLTNAKISSIFDKLKNKNNNTKIAAEDSCSECTLEESWNTMSVCDLGGNCFKNKLCPFNEGWFSIRGVAECEDLGLYFPGEEEGCPNFCMKDLGYGKCSKGKCECIEGRGGLDCSMVSNENWCSVHGDLETAGKVNYCKCDVGYVGEDCSQTEPNFPTLNPLVAQYSDKDNYQNDHPVFGSLSQVYLTMKESDMKKLLSLSFSYQDKTLNVDDLVFVNNNMDALAQDVGISIKGGISRRHLRKSYNIDFDFSDPDGRLVNLRRIALRAVTFDVSYIKDRLIHDLQYYIGVKRARSGFAQLWINNIFMGLYLLQEAFDEEFLYSRFGESEGAFYKAEGNAFFDDLGDDVEKYEDCKSGSSHCYAPKTKSCDWNDIKDLSIALAGSETERLQKVPQHMDVDDLFRNLVIEMATGQTDGLSNGKNFFLYRPKDEPFRVILHDFDMTLGFKSKNITSSTSIWKYTSKDRPLFSKTLEIEEWKDMIIPIWKDLLKQFAPSSSSWAQRIDLYRALIDRSVKMDKWHQVDFGWSYDEWEDRSLKGGVERIGGNCSSKTAQAEDACVFVMGLRDFVTLQSKKIKEQV